MLHFKLHKRSKPRHPLWPLCCMLNFTKDQSPATPFDHYVASWTSQEITTLPTLSDHYAACWTSQEITTLPTLSDHYAACWTSQEIISPSPPLTTMLHVELHKRSKPRHPLWPLCCMLNFTRDHQPVTPSNRCVAFWTWQEIISPSPPLTTMLHVELHKRSKPRHPLWPLFCILNFTRDHNPATLSNRCVTFWTWQEIISPSSPLTTMLHVLVSYLVFLLFFWFPKKTFWFPNNLLTAIHRWKAEPGGLRYSDLAQDEEK